jgi:hypothetical protein
MTEEYITKAAEEICDLLTINRINAQSMVKILEDCVLAAKKKQNKFLFEQFPNPNTAMKHCCQSQGCYKNSMPDLHKVLRGCFGSNPNCLPTDIDFVIERNSHFLWYEIKNPKAKYADKGKFTVGQDILFRNLLNAKSHTVIGAWFENPDASDMQQIRVLNKQHDKAYKAGSEEIRRLSSMWWDKVDADK